MVKIVNKSKIGLAIPNFKGFEAWEIREVSEDEAKVLLKNPNLEKAEVKQPRKTSGIKNMDKK